MSLLLFNWQRPDNPQLNQVVYFNAEFVSCPYAPVCSDKTLNSTPRPSRGTGGTGLNRSVMNRAKLAPVEEVRLNG